MICKCNRAFKLVAKMTTLSGIWCLFLYNFYLPYVLLDPPLGNLAGVVAQAQQFSNLQSDPGFLSLFLMSGKRYNGWFGLWFSILLPSYAVLFFSMCFDCCSYIYPVLPKTEYRFSCSICSLKDNWSAVRSFYLLAYLLHSNAIQMLLQFMNSEQ